MNTTREELKPQANIGSSLFFLNLKILKKEFVGDATRFKHRIF